MDVHNQRDMLPAEGQSEGIPRWANECVEIGLVIWEFPKGMSCTWDVSVAVDKHYSLG
ncbi:hypothetical protein CK203_039329 [Vitis vinifera]|uniref:(S)-ureidoglycine aminohydrolase cupin domain-containing protein n=1 Tax=Vitis vinifera TaxID=29760 RepID=A0A438HGR9_VITVI|nr:hypothetical protein CK203_039329 [Vitis vinifera]